MRVFTSLTFVIFALFAPGHSFAEESPPASDTQQQLLDAGQLDQLVAPIALYPDALVAQVLMASTYPLEVVQADRWAKANKSLKGDKLDEALTKQDWDASVKALVATPTVLAMMNDDLDWTEKLGDAVLAQQADVMDAIQRLRSKAQANGKLATTKQQTVTVTQEADKPVIVIAPASPRDRSMCPITSRQWCTVRGPIPHTPLIISPRPRATSLVARLRAEWPGVRASPSAMPSGTVFDWGHGNIHVDINKNVNINKHVDRNNVNVGNWQHNSYHRRGVSYNNKSVQNKFANADVRSGDRKLDYRGRGGEQVLKPGNKPGGGDRPNLGGQGSQGNKPNLGNGPGKKPGLGKGPGSVSSKKPDLGKGPGGAQDKRPGQQAALEGKKPDLGKGPQKARPGGNAFDASDGGKARDYAKRGQASLGSRSAGQFTKPSGGGGGHSVARGGGGSRGGGGGGGGHRGGGGGRRSDIRLKEDIVPLVRLSNGLELYRFRYKGSDRIAYVGVMAQEVQEIEPNAVWPDHNGYLMVNYDQIGLKFMTWKEWLARTSGGRQR